MIDVHILHLSDENQHWADLCNRSLVDKCIIEHHLPGVRGNVTAGRKYGWMQGNHPFVSQVDPDDIVVPQTFERCLQVLEDNPKLGGVYTGSIMITEQGQPITPYRPLMGHWSYSRHVNDPVQVHQIAVMRRDLVEQCIANPPFEIVDTLYSHLMYAYVAKRGGWMYLPQVGYYWRQKTINVRQLAKPSDIAAGLDKLVEYLAN